MYNTIELLNIEIFEHCILNLDTGEKTYNKEKTKNPSFTGLYFRDNTTFFALYPTKIGPIINYKDKEYKLSKDLSIVLTKYDKCREFSIKEYDINIKYLTSKYIGFDAWSEEIDVDLFYLIEQSYKKQEFYDKFTKK